ncbi:MAG TPA: AAA-like domain-containing protein [Oscillatoriales cyanobacterium M59_W2019_021]|nr:AAA-like domain-containing protein [Oscillatoriales cyanobacterium M4454_W2019_049]HIK51235.1 AAA-like domain-containing protein [Oscillatoriales cyanobacterium M59_W2019_021]
MNGREALEFIDRLVFDRTGKYLNDLEREIVVGTWDGKKYEEIYPLNPQYLEKDVGYKLWKKISLVLGEKVTKKKIKGALERAYQQWEIGRSQLLTATQLPPQKNQRIAIFYGESPPDWQVAERLSQALQQAGHLIDCQDEKRLSIAEELNRIERQLQQCDWLILFLSPKSANSEMAIELLRRVKELQESRLNRKPRPIAIRVNCPPHLPFNYDLREYLYGSFQYELYTESDLKKSIDNILSLLAQTTFKKPSSPPDEGENVIPTFSTIDALPLPVAEPELPSGQVRLASAFYIERSPQEELCYKEIGTPGALIRIKAPRQMGKTSLMARILYVAKDLGYRTVPLSFQHADAAVFTSLDRLLKWFCSKIARKLRLSDGIEARWSDYFGSKDNCTAYFEDCLLSDPEMPLMLGLDEVDRVFQYPKIADDFFSLLRAWYEEAGYGDTNSQLWQNLRLVVVHSTEVYVPLNVNQSPFNVGLPIELPEFTSAQVSDLARRHGLNWQDDRVEPLIALVGGHPYLVRLALYHLAQNQLSWEELLTTAATEAGLYGDHLRRHLWSLQKHPELAMAFAKVVQSQEPIELESAIAFKLHSMGLVHLQGNLVVSRFELYRQYFGERFLQ